MAFERLRPTVSAAKPFLPLVAATAVLAYVVIHAVLAQTGGQPAVPLDDSYIHFQYARAFARLQPFVYTPGTSATPGATSLLWPLLLSPFVALGFSGTRLIWIAWAFGFTALGLTAYETHRLSLGLLRREVALATGAMVLVFGGLVWCAGSGMEVVPFAWLLVRSARLSADWFESESESATRRERVRLIAFAMAAALMRPEGVIACVLVASTIMLRPRSGHRAAALLPLGTPLVPLLANHLATGQSTSTTALVKWLPLSPYHHGTRLVEAIWANVELLFGTLLDGRIWAAIFVPSGGHWIALAALPLLAAWAWRQKRRFRGAMALAVALGILIPTSYDSFLWNRLRYLWPFAPGWFVALGAIAEWLGALAERWRRDFGFVRLLVAGLFVGSFAADLSRVIDDVAESSNAILEQQVALGRWANQTLPKDALIGVNDTGAIAYFADRRVFDVVGLTTKSEARYWAAGAGSRFEHYERMPRGELPTHFIVYPEWLATPSLLGDLMTERTVHATILGGNTMAAYVADYSTLHSAEQPLGDKRGNVVDRLDVADLESEAAHGFELFWATQAEDRLFEDFIGDRDRADGGRQSRTLDRFRLELRPGGTLVARLEAEKDERVRLRVDGRPVGELTLVGGPEWQELGFALPKELAPGRHVVEVLPESGKDFASLHYFSLAAPDSGQRGS